MQVASKLPSLLKFYSVMVIRDITPDAESKMQEAKLPSVARRDLNLRFCARTRCGEYAERYPLELCAFLNVS